MLCLHHKKFRDVQIFRALFFIVSVCAFCLFSVDTLAQAPSWLWAKRTGGTSIDYTNDVAADAFGNTYITGTYYSAPITFGTVTLTNAGLTDIFLVKYDAAGNVIWARRAGNASSDGGASVATDAAGNVYITGGFSTSIVFGSTTLTSAGSSDIFVAKYDSAGTVLWARRAGSTGGDGAGSIAVTPAGDVYIGGSYNSASITFGPNTLPNYGFSDAFVAKYNTSGTALWGRHIGEYLDELVSSLAVDAAGNVYVAGSYSSLDVLIGSSVLVTNAQDAVFDIFLAKFNSSGTVLWARGAGGWEDDFANGVATDPAGNVYITGYVVSNPSTFGTLTLTTGAFSLYLAKYNSAGTIQWVTSPGFGGGFSVTTDACGDIYWTGDFGAPMTIGPNILSYSGGGDVFVAKYSSAGVGLWGMRAGGTGQETGQSITLSSFNNRVLIAGNYSSPSLAFGSTTLTNVDVDGFVAQLSPTCSIVPLPVELLSFSGKDEGVVNVLEWVTASEINNDYFSIERSSNATDFESIGTVKGMGNSSVTLNYSFVDDNPMPVGYYRLTQTDFDGSTWYSDVIAILRETNTVAVFPNPAYDAVLVYAPWKEYTAELSDVHGRKVSFIKSEKNSLNISVSELTDGVYFLSLQNNDKKIVKRIVKASAKK